MKGSTKETFAAKNAPEQVKQYSPHGGWTGWGGRKDILLQTPDTFLRIDGCKMLQYRKGIVYAACSVHSLPDN
jgi:hypothetical protein